MTAAGAPDLRVVLVDDSAESRVLLRSMLDAVTGTEVVGIAADGRQAVDSVRAAGPDAVFLDIAMPVMDGLQAAAAIRATRPDVKIIMYSGYDQGSAGASALSAGADDYLQKAFTLDQLVGQLRRVFPDRVLDYGPGGGGHPPRPTGERQRLLVGDDFRAVVEALPDPVFVLVAQRDAAGAVVELEYRFVNAAALRLYGMRWDQVAGHGQLELFPSVRENGLWERYLAVIHSGEPASIDVPSFDENGVRGGFSLSVARFGDGVIVTARDITARLRAEDELAASERRMREAFESMLDGVVILSPVRSVQGEIVDFRYEYINEAGCRLNRMPRERHIGRRLRDVLPGFRESGLFDDFVQVVQTGQPLQKRSYLYGDVFGGTQVLSRVWDISVVPFGDGIVDTFRDVTEQVTAETERRASQERLRAAVQTLKEGFFLTAARRDEGGRIVDLEYLIANAAGCAMARRAESEIVGRGYREIWPAVPAELFDNYCAVVDTGTPYSTIVRGGPSEGVVATHEVSVTQVGDGCAFVVDDVTERLRNEQQLADAHAAAQQRAEQLERSNQELRVFAAAISHDLREPLRTTAGFASLIRDQYAADLPEPARDLFGYVLSGTHRMEQRITAILDYALAGRAAAPARPVDSTVAATAAAGDIQTVLDEAGVDMRIGPLPTVAADAGQLQRVFQNLLTNAATYRSATDTPRIEISARQVDGQWEFVVADNGPGVPADARDSIFTMFRRGPGADGHNGHGMGLALCRRIIESYGGTIWVEDNPAGGSRFCFTLPTGCSAQTP